ncbi:disease resistance protein RPV1-like isoform X4 [Rhododendron vialii]|uniref:disease resistance protein RPV1-like isoform X4 n=1 Tax=Rhododendron vialii TaxID=182163 RepID=UPI00265E920C|nr:disease resistance protein RPV1-like isoform X4 [Rhododendron vialii]
MDASQVEGCSSSSIPISPQWVYDVFVSFRGADTRKKFTSHLFAALEDNGFRTFRDDKELERGEFISDGLLKAIEGSKISLIVFSKDYAGSRWCLDELVKIMDCRETFKQIVVPIFYDVVPSDVRKQIGILQDAFTNHKKRLREGPDGKVEKWRAALTKAANLSGRHLLNDGDEAELINMIIEDVRKVNPTHLNVPDRQVGLDRRVAELNVLLNMEFNCVGIVAIWGMGGIGKTTIAKRLYNLIQHKFERSGFLENVRETSQPPNGLVELQKKLLLAILKRSHELSNSHEGIEIIKKTAFGRKKVLVVLDDVDNDQQLKALAIERDSFAPGSRIIITTRDKSSLKILELGENEIYGLEKLDQDDSLELFNWHSFKEDHPPEDHLDLSRQIVHYAGGLPLALEVLGSYFRGKSIPQWERAIAKLRKIPNDDVQGKLIKSLKMSFDSLSEQLKKLFLDMACFFIGTGQDFTIKILEGCNIFAEDGIRKLADQCLIKYENYQIVMHDIIRDMGREIVRQESLEDPGKRSRLWYPDDVLEVLRYGMGTEAVNGLLLKATDVQANAKPLEKMDKLWYCEHVLEVRRDGMGTEVVEGRLLNFIDPKDVQVNAKAFERMNNLWLLHLDYVHLTTGYEHISRRLLWLSWKGFPLKCIPWNFFMEKLVALDLRYSSLKQVWNRNMILGKLKFLYLSHCHYLTRTPDFSGLSSLEELLLNDCKSLVEVDESIRCLNKLRVLGMKNCTKLRKLPSSIWMLKSLEHLDLSGCSNLGNLAVFKGPLYKLRCLFFSSWTLPPKAVDFIGLSRTPIQASSCLKKLNLDDCHLSYLPEEIGNLISLQTLDLAKNNLSTLPDGICNLTRLKHLDLEENNVSNLPSGTGRLTSLEKLNLSRNSLCTLPDTIVKLSCLKYLWVRNNKLSHLPKEKGIWTL